MTLHMVTIFDDDPTSTIGDLAAADFIGGESIVQTRDGQVPILRGIQFTEGALSGVNSIVGLTAGSSYCTLQPSTWKETEKIFHELDQSTVPLQDTTTASDFHDPMQGPRYLDAWNGGYNIQLTENMNWINSGGSQWATCNGTASNANISLFYQYGPAIPWDGNTHPCIRVTKSASADCTADVWSEVCSELFTDDGLDPDAVYRPLWGYCSPEGAGDKLTMGWRMTSTDNKCWIGGYGPGGNDCNYARTTFHHDSILINGDSQITFEALADAASKPQVTVYFQEVRKGAEPRSAAGGAARAPARARGPAVGGMQMPSLRLPAGLSRRL
jgi:hypothetical protein